MILPHIKGQRTTTGTALTSVRPLLYRKQAVIAPEVKHPRHRLAFFVQPTGQQGCCYYFPTEDIKQVAEATKSKHDKGRMRL